MQRDPDNILDQLFKRSIYSQKLIIIDIRFAFALSLIYSCFLSMQTILNITGSNNPFSITFVSEFSENLIMKAFEIF